LHSGNPFAKISVEIGHLILKLIMQPFHTDGSVQTNVGFKFFPEFLAILHFTSMSLKWLPSLRCFKHT
jgi:hypothetical protein